MNQMEIDKILNNKIKRLRQLTSLYSLSVEQAFERDKLSKETGVEAGHRVFHFGLNEYSPVSLDRGSLCEWIAWADEEEIRRTKQEKKESVDKTILKQKKKPAKKKRKVYQQVDALEGRDIPEGEDIPFGLFAISDT